jgi:3'(2'), 5'-bisphosphate nucleotidase
LFDNHVFSASLIQVTVLIGIAYKGRAVAGIIHQPFFNENGRTIWAIEGVGVHGMVVSQDNLRTVVTSRNHPSPQLELTLDSLKQAHLLSNVERVVGSGYMVLKCLEGASAEIFTGICLKWTPVQGKRFYAQLVVT